MPWRELKRLEVSCEVTLRSFLDTEKRLAWRLTLRPHDSAEVPINAEAREIEEAVRAGVEEASRRGLLKE